MGIRSPNFPNRGVRPFVPDKQYKCVRCGKYIVSSKNWGKWSTEGGTIPFHPVCKKCVKKEKEEKKRIEKARKAGAKDPRPHSTASN